MRTVGAIMYIAAMHASTCTFIVCQVRQSSSKTHKHQQTAVGAHNSCIYTP